MTVTGTTTDLIKVEVYTGKAGKVTQQQHHDQRHTPLNRGPERNKTLL